MLSGSTSPIQSHHTRPFVNPTSPYFRNQEANQVNIHTVRTKTSGSNSIKSKFATIWKFLQIFINRLFYNGLCLTVPLHFIIYLFFFLCLISVGFTCSCIYVSRGFILYFFGGQVWTGYMLTDRLPSNCKNKPFEEYILTYLLTYSRSTTTHKLQTSLISCGKSFLERDLPKYR